VPSARLRDGRLARTHHGTHPGTMTRETHAPSSRKGGLTLPGVAALLFMLAAAGMVGIPHFLSARLFSNERRAVAMLQDIALAERHFASTHADRGFGVLEELLEPAGRRPHGATSPALLLDEGSLEDGMLVANGYRFVVYTAAPDGLPLRRRTPATGPRHDRYVAYAWPIRPGVTGNAIFGMDSSGEVHLCENPPSSFSESDFVPPAGLLSAVMQAERRLIRNPPRRWLLLRWRSLSHP